MDWYNTKLKQVHTTDSMTQLAELFQSWSDSKPDNIVPMPLSGSDRRYFRLSGNKGSAIGVYNANLPENKAFIHFTQAFQGIGLPVPTIYATDLHSHTYLLEDLGDLTLLQVLERDRKECGLDFSDTMQHYYKTALTQLARLQIEGAKEVDYNYCYPTAVFNEQSMLWDCNQFKYWYLQPKQHFFDETALERDFRNLCSYLSRANSDYFMFRDFQARNIMLHRDKLYFIDYQGGRKGPLQYDVVSLLFQAKAAIPQDARKSLLQYYMQVAKTMTDLEEAEFLRYYNGFVLLRCMQVLGAYGFKGYYQRKTHFLSSIPYAIDNLDWCLQQPDLPVEMPHLRSILTAIVAEKKSAHPVESGMAQSGGGTLQLNLQSFSYRKGVPPDQTGHGIGYVFDCRLIHNPGRYDEYKQLSGLDKEVKDFFERDGEMFTFLESVFNIVDKAVSKYLQRGFNHLGINFGCTGGQHRSVYAAEAAAAHLSACFGDKIAINLTHREQNDWLK